MRLQKLKHEEGKGKKRKKETGQQESNLNTTNVGHKEPAV